MGGGDGGPPSEKLPSICQLSSCGNIFKWTLFILFDSLSEPGTMKGGGGAGSMESQRPFVASAVGPNV